MQKRHDDGDKLARAAAILSSMDLRTSSSVAFSGDLSDVDAILAVEDVAVSSSEAAGWEIEPPEGLSG